MNACKFTTTFITALGQSLELSPEEIERVGHTIGRLHNPPQYQFVALELAPSVDVQNIAEVFVRINGEASG